MKYIISILSSKTLFLGHQPGADLGPVISPQAKERICNLVQSGADEGAKVRETSYSLTLTCIFSTVFFINFLWYCWREFVQSSRLLIFGDHFTFSHDLYV